MSNCRPGELAIVVRPCKGIPCTNAMIGRTIVRVKAPLFYERGVVWVLAEPAQCPVKSECQFVELPDEILQPLRGEEGEHPGDVKRKKNPEFTPKQQTKRLDWVGPFHFSGPP